MNRDPSLDGPLRVELFGGPAVRKGSEIVSLSPYQLALLTLVYGHEERGLSRPQAIWFLWEESDDPVFRQRVRQTLHGIRKRVGRDLIHVARDMLEPAVDGIRSDLRHYRELLAAGELRQAASLHREGLASKLPRVPTREYDDWLDAKRVAVRRVLREAGARGWDAHHPTGDWPAAREAAEALYALDPQNESIVRKVIEARAMTGSREAVEAAYSEFLEALSGDRPPASETVELVRRVRTLTSVGWSEERSTPEHIPMVGRREPLARAREAIDRVRHGSFEFVLIRGEAGIGKTRLLDELKQEAHVRGFRCLSARLVELEQRIPLNPLVDAFTGAEVLEHIDALEEPWRAVIASLLPADVAIERTAELPYIQESSLSRRLLDAFALLFSRLAEDRPTLLFIDDLQWADATTLAVLHFVQRRWTSGPLGVIASIRPEAVSPDDEVGRYLRKPSDLSVAHIELGELAEEEGIRLVRNVGGEDMGHTTCAQICALGGCNPFYIIELTKDHLAGKLRLPELPSEALTVPISLQQLFEARIEHLSPPARKAAEVLAVWARWMKLADLAALKGATVEESAEYVEELSAWRLVQVDSNRVRIAHELFRSALYGLLSPSRLAVLHGAVAAHLLDGPDDVPAGELAIHFAAAGDAQSAVKYAREAAKAASEGGAITEAAHFTEIVVANERDRTLNAEATGDLAHLLHMNREIGRANPLLKLAANHLRQVGRTARALRMEIWRVDGLAEEGAPIPDLIDRLGAIKAEAREHGDWEAVARALDVELHLLDRSENVPAIRSLFDEMRECAGSGSPEAACMANASLALNVLYGDGDEALVAARRAVRTAKEGGIQQTLFLAQNRLLVVLHYRGMLYLPEGQDLIADATEGAASIGDVTHRFHFESNLGVFHLEAGDLDQAGVLLYRALSLIAGAEAAEAQLVHFTNLGELALRKLDFDAATELFLRAEAMFGPTTPKHTRQLANAGLGLCALETGALSEARRREEKIEDDPASFFYDPSPVVTLRARMMDRRGELEDALHYVSTASEGLRERLTFAWLKLRTLEARLGLRVDRATTHRRLLEAKEVAHGLRLMSWVTDLQALLDRTAA